jgi:hypothetical protein
VLPAAISKILAAIALSVAAVTGGHAAHAGSTEPVAQPTHQSLRESERAIDRMTRERPTGRWMATGHVLVADGIAERTTGEVLGREWAFGSICDPDHCRTTFTRTAEGGLSEAVLRAHDGYLTAGFPRISDGCEVSPGWFADFTGRFRMWWADGHRRLVAIEVGRWAGDSACPPAEERIRWVARKAPDSTARMRPPEPHSERTHQML